MYTVRLGTRESGNLAVCVFVWFNILHVPATKSASTVALSGGLPVTGCKSLTSLLPINDADESVKTTLKPLGSMVTEAAVLTSVLPARGPEPSDRRKLATRLRLETSLFRKASRRTVLLLAIYWYRE